MATKNPQTVAANWSAHLASAGQKITDGVNGVTVAPGVAASRNKAGYVAGVTQNQDKWASHSAAVPLSDWQQAVIQKGVPRIASGAQAAEPKFAQFMTQLLPFIDSAKASLPARGTLDQNIARMDAMARKMATFKKQ